MAERLGKVIYWAASAFAVLWAVALLYFATTQAQPAWSVIIPIAFIGTGIIWIIGRAIRYILAGR